MKKNVVVLDFDGLFSYPDFRGRFLEPLLEQNRDVVIWTFNLEERIRDKLEKMEMPDYARSARVIDSYRYQWLKESLRDVLNGSRSADNGEFIKNLLQDPDMPSTGETVSRALEHYGALIALESGGRAYKYPPFLGEDNYLLVESDRASGFGGPLTRRNPKKEIEISEFGGHSLIMVPEHPDCWNEFVYPPLNATPEQVMDLLVPTVLNWSGETIRRDLAVEFGIFQESEGGHQEQIGRPMERF